MELMLYAKGICWIDDCRIPFVSGDTTSAGKRTCNIFETEYKSGGNGSPDYITDSRGRFPANILVSDDMLNDGVISKGTGVEKLTINNHSQTQSKYQYSKLKKQFSIADKGTSSRYYDIDKWFDNLLKSCE